MQFFFRINCMYSMKRIFEVHYMLPIVAACVLIVGTNVNILAISASYYCGLYIVC